MSSGKSWLSFLPGRAPLPLALSRPDVAVARCMLEFRPGAKVRVDNGEQFAVSVAANKENLISLPARAVPLEESAIASAGRSRDWSGVESPLAPPGKGVVLRPQPEQSEVLCDGEQ